MSLKYGSLKIYSALILFEGFSTNILSTSFSNPSEHEVIKLLRVFFGFYVLTSKFRPSFINNS